MQQVLRPYATAGVAIVGAGLVAITPTAAMASDHHRAADVALTSALGDALAPWIEQYNTAANNASIVANNYFLAPSVATQQFWSNLAGYAQEVIKDPSSLTAVTEEMRDNYKTVMSSLTLTDADKDTISQVDQFTIAGDHSLIYSLIPGFLPASDSAILDPIINFLGSPVSGIIMGSIGPEISPLIALVNSMTAGDGINETLANMVGAYFNGATLNLSSLLPTINGAGLLPSGMSFDHLDLAFGGLFSTGENQQSPWNLYGTGGETVAKIPVPGGSMFNSVGLDIGGVPVLGHLDAPSHAIGPLGAWLSLSELVGLQLGSKWNASEGKNEPSLGANPPGAGIHFPTFPVDGGDDSGSAASSADVGSATAGADLSTLISDAITNFQWSDVF